MPRLLQLSLAILPFFQIAYRTASDKFPGKLSELFLVLSDNLPPQLPEGADGFESQQPGRGHKHRLDDDQMSVESSESKRPDVTTSAEKNHSKNKPGKGGKQIK